MPDVRWQPTTAARFRCIIIVVGCPSGMMPCTRARAGPRANVGDVFAIAAVDDRSDEPALKQRHPHLQLFDAAGYCAGVRRRAFGRACAVACVRVRPCAADCRRVPARPDRHVARHFARRIPALRRHSRRGHAHACACARAQLLVAPCGHGQQAQKALLCAQPHCAFCGRRGSAVQTGSSSWSMRKKARSRTSWAIKVTQQRSIYTACVRATLRALVCVPMLVCMGSDEFIRHCILGRVCARVRAALTRLR